MSSAATPGPWAYTVGVEDDETRCVVHQKDADRDWIIAVIENGAPGDSLETEKANARLIAAAPDLLEACKAALVAFDSMGEEHEDHKFLNIAYIESRSKLLAACASAGGRQS